MVGRWMIVLDGCFVIDLCNDDFSTVGSFLLTCKNQVSVKNAGIDHGISLDAQCKDVATAGEEVSVDGDCAFEVLDGENRRTGGNATDDRNLDGVAWCIFARIFGMVNDFDTTAESRRAIDIAFFDKGGENGTDSVC